MGFREGGGFWRVVEVHVDVEEELVFALWKAFVEFLLDFAVGGADVVGDHVFHHHVRVEHFGELGGGEVVEQEGAVADD